MAKQMNGVKITVEDQQARYTFDAHEAYLSSTDGGVTTHLSVSPLKNKLVTSLPEKEEAPVPPEAWNTDEPAVDPVKAAALKHVKLMARKIERTKLANARRVEEAHETGQANLNFAAHDFNEAVLSATHEGIEYEDIQAHLTAEGIHGLSHDVACASGRDWDLLYPSVVE